MSLDYANLEDLATDLGHATRLVVVEGEAYDPGKRRRNRPVLVVDDAVGISELVRFLIEGAAASGDEAVMEPAAHTVVFLRERDVVARFGLVGEGRWIRAELGGDRRMRSTIPLVRWLKQRTQVDDEVLRRGEAWFESYAPVRRSATRRYGWRAIYLPLLRARDVDSARRLRDLSGVLVGG